MCLNRVESCMIGLFDGSQSNTEEYIELLKAQGYFVKSQAIDLYWLDASCHYEMLL